MGRRHSRFSDPNKVGTISNEVTQSLESLLMRYFAPVINACPLDMNPDNADKSGRKVYRLMMEANGAFKELQEYIRDMEPTMRDHINLMQPNKRKMIRMCIWLPQVEARGIVNKCGYPPADWVKRAFSDSSLGNHVFIDPDTKAPCSVFGLTDAVFAQAVPVKLGTVFAFDVPMTTPRDQFLLAQYLSTTGDFYHNNVYLTGRSEGGFVAGQYPTFRGAFHMLPCHPQYTAWAHWATSAHLLKRKVERMQKLVSWLLDNTNTVGQLKRVFPLLQNFCSGKSKEKLIQQKQRSPLADLWQPTNFEDANNEVYRARMAVTDREVAELTTLCTRAIMMPHLEHWQENVVDQFETNWWAYGVPETSMWNALTGTK